MTTPNGKAGPLAGVRVLELGSMYAAPTCGRMLRDFGAEVIKVEDPTSGDYARQWTPMKNGQSFGFARLNSGKRSVAIDLRSDDGPRPHPQARGAGRRRHRELPARPDGRVGARLPVPGRRQPRASW